MLSPFSITNRQVLELLGDSANIIQIMDVVKFSSCCSCYVLSQKFAYFFLETSGMFRHFAFSTKTTQTHPQVFSVNSSIIWQFSCTIYVIS